MDLEDVDLVGLFGDDGLCLLVVFFGEQLHVPNQALVIGDSLLIQLNDRVLLLFGACQRSLVGQLVVEIRV